MSSKQKCNNCGSSVIEADGDRGDTVCKSCGFVLEDSIFVSEVQFNGSANVFGHFVSADSKGGAIGYGNNINMGKDSQEITLRKARQGITHLSHQLYFNNHCIETACNFFKLALMRHLTHGRGRNNTHIYAACVYITCRTEGTCHLLIDISDVAQICCHELGSTYFKLARALHINIPSIDPCLYIMRFAKELEFGAKTHEVSTTAQRLVQRMMKDSIQTGRKSSGLYGAGLLIAARMHDFSRTPMDIVRIVKIHESTLRRRLNDFGDTPSSVLTLDEFLTVDLEAEEDPPAFKAAQKRDRERLQKLSEHHAANFTALQLQIDSYLEKEINNKRNLEPIVTEHYESTLDTTDESDAENLRNSKKKRLEPTDLNSDRALVCLHAKSVTDQTNCTDVDTGESDLDGLDDDEINRYIFTEKEVKHKDIMWNRLNAEYLKEAKAKNEQLAKEKGASEKKRQRNCRQKNINSSNTTGKNIFNNADIMQEKNISYKINYDILKSFTESKCDGAELSNVVDETPVALESMSWKSINVPMSLPISVATDQVIEIAAIDNEGSDDFENDENDADDAEPIDSLKAIDTLNPKELRQLLNYRSSDKSSLSSLRARSYDLLRSNYLSTKSRLQTILDKQNETVESRSTSPQTFSAPVSTQSQSSNLLTSLTTPAASLASLQSQVNCTPYNSFQPQITSFLHQFEQFANNKTQQQLPSTQIVRQPSYQRPQPILPPISVPQVAERSATELVNNGIMYQSNLNTVTPATGNGAVTLPHTNGLVNSSYGAVQQPNVAQNLPVHPDVRLKKLAFFDVMATLLKPSTLIPTSNTQRMQEGTYYFHLTPQQATDIASNRDVRNTQKIDHIIQVQLRFCLLETTSEQEDYFPPNVIVKVNNKLCPLPNPIPKNKPGVEPKRPPRPVNITTNVKLSPTVANNINVTWCTDFSRGFVISAYLVKKLTYSQLLQRMKSKPNGIQPEENTRAFIIEKLKEDADCEIATTELRVSLMCPLGKMRMTTPCQASTCKHLQCFDASLYLQMNERKPTWNCPVCDKPALYESLVIDGYFQEVLQSSRLPSDINEIQLLNDGSWTAHDSSADASSLDTPRKVTHKVEVISDDIEVIIEDDSPKTSIKTQAMNGGNNGSTTTSKPNEPSSTTTGDSVDLTLSNSDDECVQVRQGNNNNTNNNSSASNKGPSATPVITNDAIISLDSPSPPLSPSILSARHSDFTGNGYTNISTASANLNAALLANSFDAQAYLNFPDFSSVASQSSIDRF